MAATGKNDRCMLQNTVHTAHNYSQKRFVLSVARLFFLLSHSFSLSFFCIACERCMPTLTLTKTNNVYRRVAFKQRQNMSLSMEVYGCATFNHLNECARYVRDAHTHTLVKWRISRAQRCWRHNWSAIENRNKNKIHLFFHFIHVCVCCRNAWWRVEVAFGSMIASMHTINTANKRKWHHTSHFTLASIAYNANHWKWSER